MSVSSRVMSKNGKLSRSNDQDDIQRFENYERNSKADYLERLRNKDILNYIKDIQQNCRLEVSSGDEDYAGTKRSSHCSVRFSDAKVKLSKGIKSKVSSRRNKNVASLKKKKKKTKGSLDSNDTNACIYCSSLQNCDFYSSNDPNRRENLGRDLNVPFKAVYRSPKLSRKRDFYRYRESPTKFYGWYSRKDRKTQPTVSEMTSLEIIKNCSQNGLLPNSRIRDKSRIAEKKSAKNHKLKSMQMRNLDDTIFTNVYSHSAPTEKMKKGKNTPYIYEQRGYMEKLKEESDLSDYANQQLLNKLYPMGNNIDEATCKHTYETSLKNQSYKKRETPRYPIRKCTRSTCWAANSRPNRLSALAKLSSLPRENEVRLPLKASSSLFRSSLDKNYHQTCESNYNNMDERRQKPHVLGEQESLYYHKQGSLREPKKPYKVSRIRKSKQCLGCCYEDYEKDETTNCSKYYHCPENMSDFIKPNYQPQSTYRSIRRRERNNYTERDRTFHLTFPKSIEIANQNKREASDLNLSAKEDVNENRNKNVTYDDRKKSDISDDDEAICYNDKNKLKDLKTYVPLPDDWMDQTRRLNRMTREYKKLNNNLNTSQREMTETSRRTMLRRRIIKGYSSSKEFPCDIKAPRKLVLGNSPKLERNIVQATCKCKEPFHDPPAVCLTGSCDCVRTNENVDEDSTDSSQRISVCCCSSDSSNDENDPVRKLESFCERVKAVNQNAFYNQSNSGCCNHSMSINAQRDLCCDECESEISIQTATQITRPDQKEQLADSARLRLTKPTHGRNKTNLSKILIYPPRGEGGPPLTLYKKWSNINCRVKGDASKGFRYNVTYVQKFVSPMWMPSLSMEVPSKEEITEECDCSSEYG